MGRSPEQAIAWMRAEGEKTFPGARDCLKTVRTAYGAAGGYNTANEAWHAVPLQHRYHSAPPRGAVMWWTSAGAGHVAISLGRGMVLSTDAPTPGGVGEVAATWFDRHWPNHQYAGWSDWINGESIRVGRAGGRIQLKRVPLLTRVTPGERNVHVHSMQVELIARGHPIASGATGYFGDQTRAAVASFQRAHKLGNPDGVPGPVTWRLLFGNRGR
jgi:peptidoglycan hydrolase-like protein with peptidoglycan-binding domain